MLGILFLLTRPSSIGISSFSQMVRALSTDCVASASRSSLKKATMLSSPGHSSPMTNLFVANIFEHYGTLSELPS